jgi:glycosyltransferase involved in cell wall biosynthesis
LEEQVSSNGSARRVSGEAESEAEQQVVALRAECAQLQQQVAALRQGQEQEQGRGLVRQLELDMLRRKLGEAQKALGAIRSSPVYRIFSKLGRWSWLEPVFERTLPPLQEHPPTPTGPPKRICIAIDMTPVLPGGDNGGAKLVAIGLIRQLARLAPEWDFVLMTSGKSHDELAYLDGPNVRRVCVIFQGEAQSLQQPIRLMARLKVRVGERLVKILPPPVFDRLRKMDAQMSYKMKGTTLLRKLGADLYFCVFTAPNFYDPAVPVVSTIYDLQYKYYPQFFSSRELYYREKHFQEAARVAAKIVCISDFVRGTVVENTEGDPDRVVTSYIRLWKRIERPEPAAAQAVWQRLGVKRDEYLFFPANFWPHKNHTMLLTAFGMYKRAHPDSKLKLVLTGAPDSRMRFLQEAAAPRMGLEGEVVFAGFLPDAEFAALLEGCRAVIFPSLYEGFGMPVLEAMIFGKPILCSNVTSLPEVAGDAAILFDPRRPVEIVEAIEKIVADDQLAAEMVQRGFERVRWFGSEEQMAREYLTVFRGALGSHGPFISRMNGLHPDHWTTDAVRITYDAGPEGRVLELQMAIPRVPAGKMTVRMRHNARGPVDVIQLSPEAGLVHREILAPEGGFIEMEIGPLYRPSDVGLEEDGRELGFMCQRCQIVMPSGETIDLLKQEVLV